MPSFFDPTFALAGLAAAAGPVIIHLLNRRRYRVVNWAAMDFLREALERNRRILHLRDLILLALRTLCVLLFGLAMARPYFTSAAAVTDSGQPVHAVLIVDNSASMGFERFEGTLLDVAKARAQEFIERLPQGSRMTILPLCGSASAYSRDAYRTPEDARDALSRIEVVDRSGTASQAADLALEACGQVPELPSKRVVFIGDQQIMNWPTGSLAEQLKQLPEMQVVPVAAEDVDNAWVSGLRLQDDIADIETPAVFLATIRYEGPTARTNVPVTLTVDNAEVASQTVDLEPGQTREVRFTHRFDLPIEPGQAAFIPASVAIPPDRLKNDDKRFLSVPVVAALPVLFVDQYGENEHPQQGRYGETFHLRRLLAPVTSRDDFNRQLVQIRHRTIDQVDRQALQDVRLVVIAGVEQPGPAVSVLREYVQQGGQLVITAGAAFDPAAWTNQAWLDGGGILPLPLQPQSVGRLPDEAARIEPFFMDPETMVHDYFYVEESSREELAELYRTPLFFKAVVPDATDATLVKLQDADVGRIMEERRSLAEVGEQQKTLADKQARGTLSSDEQQQLAAAEEKRKEVEPAWLLWNSDRQDRDRDLAPEKLAQRWRPRVLAAFSNKVPFLVERQLGRGQVLFVSSGVHSPWNNLTKTNAVLIFDQILRTKLARTLPPRNFSSLEPVVLPVEPADRRAEFSLTRPNGRQESLAVDALGADQYGIALRDVTQRGIYRVVAQKPRMAAQPAGDNKLWEVSLAVNGPEYESELQPISETVLHDRLGDANYRWIPPGQSISLEGAQISGHDLWKWLMIVTLVLLLAELAVIAWPEAHKEATA